MPLAELRWLRAFRRCDWVRALFGLKLALRWPKLPPSCLLVAILPPMLPASCFKRPPKRASGRQDAILEPSWPRLGSQNGSFVWEGLLFSAYRLFCLKIA